MTSRGGRRAQHADRAAAGRALAEAVLAAGVADGDRPVVVLALPRGGVPVAVPVAERLGAPLDVVLVRKLGLPWQPELAMGAVARVGGDGAGPGPDEPGEHGVRDHVVRNEDVLARSHLGTATFEEVLRAERAVLDVRSRDLRGDRPGPPVAGRVAVLVDDGLATGATMRAAVAAVRAQGAARVVVAVPVGSREACAALAQVADLVVCPWAPRFFEAVGRAYRDFSQTGDDEVKRLLADAWDAGGS
ncbi:MAG: phosphoribosyltransferase [Kineosporiaceae bacterium]